MKKKSHSNYFAKTIRCFTNKHRRAIRLSYERTIGTIKTIFMSTGLIGVVVGSPGYALAANLPTGAQVVSGGVNINQSGANNLIIIQQSQSAIVNWESFDIGKNAFVDIVQPNIDSAMLSRVIGANPSEIFGTLNATGHLYLVNPNGIIFGKDSSVNVHALIASTLDIADSAFLSGNISFHGDSEAAVMNLGSINAKDFATLIGGKVDNSGSISVPGGDAALLAANAVIEVGDASGGKITLDLSGLLGGTATNSGSIDVLSSSMQGGSATILGEQVVVSGSVDASGTTGGGQVLIGGDYQGGNSNLANAQSTNISGTISADSTFNGDGGRVIIWADGVTTFTGDLSATGSGLGSGGFAEVSGKKILNFEGLVDLTSYNGQTGSLLLDPTNITISSVASNTSIATSGSTVLEPSATAGSIISLSTLNTALASSNVTIQTSAGGGAEVGNISVDSGLAISGSNNLSIIADGDVTMISGSINLGAGDLSVTAGNTRSDGTILLFSSITAGDLVLIADDAIQITGAVDVSNGGGTISGTVSQTAGSVTINNITTPATISSSTNNGNVTIQGSGNLSIDSITAGTAQVSVTSTSGLVIDHASDTTADITADTVILSAATGLGSSAAIELASATSISASSGGSGNIDIDHVADAATSITTIAQTGTGNVLFDQTGSQTLAITNNATTASGNLNLTTDGTLALAVTSVTGDLSLTSSGAITDTGTITVSGTTTLASGAANNITFDTTSNNFGTVILTNGNNITLVDTNAITLGASTVSGNLNVTGGGAITDSGVLAVTGTSSFTAGANAITLDLANDFGGAVSLSNTGSNNVVIDDANNLALGTVTIGGDFTVDNVGTITQSGVVTVSGNTVLDNQDGTDASITLTNAANAFTGTVTFTTDTGSNVSLTDTTALDLQSGLSINDLTIEAGGAITQSGALTVAGDSSFTAGANAITLTQAANDFTGAVSLSNSGTNDVGVTDANAIDLGTIGVGQNLAVTASGAITDTGVLTIGGTSTFDNSGGSNAAIDLGSSSTFTGNVTFTTDAGSDVTINDSTAFVIQSGLNVNNLNLTAGGAVTDAGNIDIDGTLTVSATGQTVALGGTGNDLTGNVTLTGGAVTLVDTTATAIAGITATGALSVTSGGAITQSGVITNDGQTAVLNAGTNAITLDQSNDFGTLDVDGSVTNLAVTDSDDLILAAVTTSGTLQVTAGGALTDSGTIVAGGATTISNTGNTVVLDDASNNFAAIGVTGSDVTLVDTNAIDLAATTTTGTLSVTAGGAVSDSGTIVAGGATTISNAGNTVILDDAANNFTAIGVTGSTVTLVDVNAVDLATTTATGGLSVTAGGAITDSGVITNTGQTATLNAGANAITLDQSSDFGTLDINGAVTDLSVTDSDGIILAAVSTSGTLQVTAGGAVSDSGTIVAGGATTISNVGNSVILDDGSNNFAAIGVTGSVVTLVDTNAIDLATITATGALSVTAGGAITDSGVITNDGQTAVLNAGTNAITLDQSSDFGTLDVNGAVTNLAVTDSDDLNLAAVTTSGTLQVTAGGALTDSGTIVAGGATTISNVGNSVVLDDASNNFAAIGVTGSVVTLVDTNAIDLATTTATGVLNVTAGGAITQSAAIAGSSTSSYTTTADDSDITLTHADNALVGAITLVSTDTNNDNTEIVQLTNNTAGGTILAGSTNTGTLTVVSALGAITQTGALNVGSTSSFTTSANDVSITLGTTTNAFVGNVTVSSQGTTGNVTIDNGTTALGVQGTANGNLALTSGQAITDSASLTVSGTTTATTDVADKSITLDQLASTGDVSLNSSGTTGNAVVNNTSTALGLAASSIGGTLAAETDNSITVKGTVTSKGVTSVSASDDVIFAAAGALASTNGNITITADDDNTPTGTGGAITMADGATINSGTGTITLSADEDVVLGGLTTTNATGAAVAITSDNGSITDGGNTNVDITASTTGAVVTLTAKNAIGTVSGDSVYLDPSDTGYAGNPLETAMLTASITTSAVNSDIAIDNTSSTGLTLTALQPGGAANAASAWIRNSAALDVSGITINSTNNSADELAFIATTGNLTVQDIGTTPLNVGTAGVLKLEAPSGDVTETGANDNLSVTAQDFILKSGTSETVTLAVTNLDAQITGTGNDLVATQTTGDLVLMNLDGSVDKIFTKDISVYADGAASITTSNGSQNINDGVFANTESLTIAITGVGEGLNISPTTNAYVRAATGIDIDVVNGDVNFGTVDGKSVDMATTSGNLTLDINTPTVVRTINFGDDDTSDVTTILAEGDVTIRNDGAGDTGALANFAGTINFKKDSSLTASFNQSGLNTGTVSLSGAITTDGTINVEQSRTATIAAQFADMKIKETGVVGGGALTLNPGTGNDIDVEAGGVITVTKSSTLPGSLTIGAAGSPINEFNMEGSTSALNVDGSAKIYANSVRLVDVVIDVDGNGGNTDGTTASVFYVEATTGNIELAGTIRANADTDTALNQNNVTLVSTAGNIVNNSGSVIAIDQVNSLTLTANGSIGTSTAPVTVNAKVVTLTSNATTGIPNIYIENNPKVLNNDSGSSQVTLGAVTTGTLLGNISYKQTGQNLLISGGVTSNGGSILIDPPVDVIVSSDIDAGGGNITLQASNDISFTGGDLISSGAATILVQADSDSDGSGNLTFTNAGTSAADAKVRTGSGTIQLRGEHISLNDFSALTTGKIDILAGQGGASTGEVFSGSAANGSFDLSAATFDIEAKGAGIGQTGGNTLEIVSSGQVDAEADAAIHITSVATNALSVGLIDAGANTVTLVGNANVTDTGTDSATDIIATTLTINDGAAGSAGIITLDTAVTTLNLIGGDVTIHDGDGIDIAAITATSLDLLTTGGITDSGAVSVTGLAKFNSTGNSIVLGDATTANFGSLGFSGSAVTISEASAMEIAASEATGALNLTASGAITQTGVIDAVSTSIFNAGANTITLTQANDFAGAVSLSNTGTNLVEVIDANAINLGTVNVGGALKVTSSGTITDTGNLTVVGLATLVSGGNAITLGDGTTANFGSLDFSGSTVTITEASAMEIAASEATGALSLTATGAITQSGRIDADNTTLLVNTSGTDDNIILTNLSNDFSGAVSVTATDSASDVTIKDANAIDLGTVSVGQNLTIASTGAITNSGNISISGLSDFNSAGNAITLNGTVALSTLTVNGGVVSITETNGVILSGTSVASSLELITTTGSITDATGSNLSVSGLTSLNSVDDSSIALDGTISLGSLTVDGGSVQITEADGVELTGDSSAASLLLTLNGGSLTDAITSTLTVTGDSVLNVDNGVAITLDGSNDFQGTLSIAASSTGNVLVNDINSLILADGTVAKNLSITSGGDITQGTTNGFVVTGTTTLDVTSGVGSDITLSGANNDFGGALTVIANESGSDVQIIDKNDIQIGSFNVGNSVVLTSTAGSINDASDDTIVDFTAGGLITLTAQDEIGAATGFTNKSLEVADGSKVNVSSLTAGDIGIASLGSIELVDVDTNHGAINVSAAGLITATDVISLGSTADAITLSTTQDGVVATSVNSADAVTISAAAGEVVATSVTAANSVSIDATTGGVTATSVTSGNDATITASGDIIGTSVTATDQVSVTTSLGDVTVGSITATTGTLGITASTGSINDATNDNIVDLTAGGLITLTAEDEIGDHATFSDQELELASGSSVDASSTTVGTIRLDGLGDLTLTDVDTTNGSITVSATGLITATDVVTGNNNNISLTGNGIAVSLINAGTTGDVTLKAGTGAITQDGTDDKDDVTADVLTADATTGIDLDTTVVSANISVSGTGSITIDELDALTLTDVDTIDGTISVSTGGAIVATDVVSVGTTKDVTLTSASGAVTGTLIKSSGSMTITASSGTVELVDVDTTNGSITVSATGLITATDVVTGNNNNVNLTGTGIAVSLINAGTSGDVTLNAGTGAITQDGTDDKDDVTADVLTADATVGIDLDTTVASANISVSGTGVITLDESDSIILTDLDTVNGTITVTSGGAMTATDIQAGTNSNIALTTTTGDITGVGTITAGTGNVVLVSAASVIDDGISSTLISANDLDITAETSSGSLNKVEVDTTVTSLSITAHGTDIDETDDIVLDEVSVSTLDLTAGGSVSDIDVDSNDVSSVKVTGSTKVNAGTNIILNSSSNEFGELDLTAVNKVIIRENAAVSGKVVAKSLQVQGTTGIKLVDSTSVSSLAASSDSGSIELLNTGGLSIDDFSTDSDLPLNGVELKSGTAEEGKIDLKTKSPITVNAPITNLGEGQIILAALGKESTDDITINSSISGDDLMIYAGDSIILNSSANLVIVDSGNNHAQSSDSSNNDLTGISNGNSQFFYGTDFTNEIVQQGASSGNVIIQDSATLKTLVEVSNSVRTEYIFDGISNRLTYGTPEQIQDAYNLSDPNLESLDIWSSLNYGNVIISNEYSEEEEDEDTKISISKIRD